jgi:hypothetical protein
LQNPEATHRKKILPILETAYFAQPHDFKMRSFAHTALQSGSGLGSDMFLFGNDMLLLGDGMALIWYLHVFAWKRHVYSWK